MKKIFILCVSLLFALMMCSCAEGEETSSWQLTDTVTARFSDDGSHGYILTVEGSGAMPDYASESLTPWYGRAGRVTQVNISDGITYVGDYTFSGCAYVSYVILPDSVNEIGQCSFNRNIMVCTYGAVDSEDVKVYGYSETKPETSGNYWHMLGGIPAEWQTVSVLFVGNSFTFYNDLPELFKEVANGAGALTVTDSVTNGSWTLKKFADEADAYGARVAQKLAENDYDAVVLQEQSTTPIDSYDSFLQGATALADKINSSQDGCGIYLYATWGFPKGLGVTYQSGTYTTIPEMEAAIRSAYERVAKETGAKVSYVGEAFTYVYNNYPQINLYNDDGHHPSYAGSYLAACVHAATITGCDPRETSFIGSLEKDTAQILQKVAYDIVSGR